MRRKFRLFLFVPVILFLVSVLALIFSPLAFIPCEVSNSSPVTNWESYRCDGYYLTLNKINAPQTLEINNSALLLNLLLLLCGSLVFNGIVFLLFFIISLIRGDFKEEHFVAPEAPIEDAPLETTAKKRFSVPKVNLPQLTGKAKIKFFKPTKKNTTLIHTELDSNQDI